MSGGRFRWWGIVADALCVVIFVVIGRHQHDIDGGLSWIVLVAWPFIIGLVGVGVVSGSYRSNRPLFSRRSFVSWVAGIVVSLIVRVVFTRQAIPVPFDIVACLFLGLFTLGWRVIASLVMRMRGVSSLTA